MTLRKRDRDLLDTLAQAAMHHGWQEDQGTGSEPERASLAYEAAYKAMERRLTFYSHKLKEVTRRKH